MNSEIDTLREELPCRLKLGLGRGPWWGCGWRLHFYFILFSYLGICPRRALSLESRRRTNHYSTVSVRSALGLYLPLLSSGT